MYVISDFRRDVDESYAVLGYYAALSGSAVPTFRDNLSVPSSRVKDQRIGCPETSVQNYHSTLRNIPEERRSLNCALLLLLTPWISEYVLKATWSLPVIATCCKLVTLNSSASESI
jgi:hypothetical protein